MISIGALKEVVEGKQAEATIVQVIGVRLLPGKEEKWRLNKSDGWPRLSSQRRQRSPRRQRR